MMTRPWYLLVTGEGINLARGREIRYLVFLGWGSTTANVSPGPYSDVLKEYKHYTICFWTKYNFKKKSFSLNDNK